MEGTKYEWTLTVEFCCSSISKCQYAYIMKEWYLPVITIPFLYPLDQEAPYLLRNLSDRTVAISSSTTLDCHANGVPEPQITWFKNNHKIQQEPGKRLSSLGFLFLLSLLKSLWLSSRMSRTVDRTAKIIFELWFMVKLLPGKDTEIISYTDHITKPVEPSGVCLRSGIQGISWWSSG